jgi:hypothetical protein
MILFLVPNDPLNIIYTNTRLSREQEIEFYIVSLQCVHSFSFTIIVILDLIVRLFVCGPEHM